MQFPALPDPEALCQRPSCDHTQADHSRLLLMRCMASDCDCPRFVGAGMDELLAAVARWVQERTSGG